MTDNPYAKFAPAGKSFPERWVYVRAEFRPALRAMGKKQACHLEEAACLLGISALGVVGAAIYVVRTAFVPFKHAFVYGSYLFFSHRPKRIREAEARWRWAEIPDSLKPEEAP